MAGSDPGLSPFSGPKRPTRFRVAPGHSVRPASSVAGGLPFAISDNVLPQPSRRSLHPLRAFSIVPQCPHHALPVPVSTETNMHRHSFLAGKSHRAPSLVKALDRFAAHLRAALTSLGTRMQKPPGYEGMPQSVRSPNRSACTFALFYPSKQTCVAHAQLPGRPPSDFRPLPRPPTKSNFGTETSSSHKRVCKAATRTDGCHPTVCLSAPIWQEASQAASRYPDGLVIN